MRATGPMNTRPRVRAGRRMLMKPSAVQIGPLRPWKGSRPAPPTYWISSSPTQKTGTDTPITDSAMMARSTRVPRRRAARGTERDAERHRPDQAGQHQLDGRPEGERDLLRYQPVGNHGAAEIELQDSGQIATELHPERLVEAHLQADGGDVGLGRGGPRDDRRRIGRHDLQQQEADQQHAQQHR